MIYRLRLLLLGLGLLFTSLALEPQVQASECDDGTVLWHNVGCCSPQYIRQNALRCDGGTWVGTSSYRCFFASC